MSARQQHGFIFENDYSKANNIALNNADYTAKWDGVCNETGLPVSFKTAKEGTGPSMGDIFRQSQVTENFILIIGYWSNSATKTVERVEKVVINGAEWNKLFIFDKYAELKTWIKSVSNDYSYDAQWTAECKEWKAAWKGNLPSIYFKRDHKSAKRIQCGFSNKIWNNEEFKKSISA